MDRTWDALVFRAGCGYWTSLPKISPYGIKDLFLPTQRLSTERSPHPSLRIASTEECHLAQGACFPGQRITYQSRGTKVWVPPGVNRVMPAPGILLGSGLSHNCTAVQLLPCQALLLEMPYISNKHPAQNSRTHLAPGVLINVCECTW